MQIIHLSFDHPDRIDPNKTKAVMNLCASQKHEQNIIFSLNRSARIRDDFKAVKEDHGYSMRIFGLPFGILLHLWMYLAYLRILKKLREAGLEPGLIHAHKLTFEGIIAWYLAKKLGVPFIVTFRGNTDLKVIRYRRIYRALYRKIISDASGILFLAPWTLKCLEHYYHPDLFRQKSRLVPNMVNLHRGENGSAERTNRFVSVFHFRSLKTKNIKRVLSAFDQIMERHPGLGLDIIGSGPEEGLLRTYIAASGYPEHYHMLGHMDNRELVERLPGYLGLVLPSYPETFGLVFIEALSAGIPIIYSENSGIDGYFTGYRAGERVNHRSVSQIRTAIEKLIDQNANYRSEVVRLQASGELDIFSSQQVGDSYSRLIRAATTLAQA
jgi:glycosyltransferase involved in cell wall biosynthesis